MKTALLIIDLQNDYFEGGSNTLIGSDSAADNASVLLNLFRKNNLPVIHVQHIATRPTATFFLPDTFGAQIHEKVKPAEGEKVIIKHFPNAFRETELLEYLNQQTIGELIVCGMMTHMCVDATVRAAKDFGFDITLIADACATKDQEILGKTIKASEVHHSFLAAMNYFYSRVLTTNDFLLTIE